MLGAGRMLPMGDLTPVLVRGRDVQTEMSLGLKVASTNTVRLRLIETTDLHLHLMPYDYYSDRPASGLGLVEASVMIEQARREVSNTLLFDNGDFLQGTPVGDCLAFGRGFREGDVHPMMAAMNALGYDALTLGNHEFNFGLDFLMKSMAGAKFPVVSANIHRSPDLRNPLVAPYVILDRHLVDGAGQAHAIKIGVIGFLPPQVTSWDHHHLAGRVWSEDIIHAAQRLVPQMREAGADLVVALAHSGIGGSRHVEGMENAAIPLARIPGIDALMVGHNHLLFPSPVFAGQPDVDVNAGTIAGKPAVMAGCWGSQIGVIDLLLVRDGRRWQVLGSRSEIRSLPDRLGSKPRAQRPARVSPCQTKVKAAVMPVHRRVLTSIRKPVGISAQPLHTYFAHLGQVAALAVAAEAQREHVSRTLSDPGLCALPMLSAVPPFQAGGRGGPDCYTDVPAGPIAMRHIADLYPFPNTIAALRLTGAQVLDWLERSATAFNQVRPGTVGTPLRSSDVPSYTFEVISGLDVVLDLTQPARFDALGNILDPDARRVASARYQGVELDAQQDFILCTNSFRTGGGGAFPGATVEQTVLSQQHLVRDLLRDHVARLGGIGGADQGSLRFKPVADASVIFETGPGALAHLDEIAQFAPEQRGTTPAGFVRLKLDMSGKATIQ